MVQDGAGWCRGIGEQVKWSRGSIDGFCCGVNLVQHGAGPYSMVQDHIAWCRTMLQCAGPCCRVQNALFHSAPASHEPPALMKCLEYYHVFWVTHHTRHSKAQATGYVTSLGAGQSTDPVTGHKMDTRHKMGRELRAHSRKGPRSYWTALGHIFRDSTATETVKAKKRWETQDSRQNNLD